MRTAALLLLPAALLTAPHASAATPTDRTITVNASERATWQGAAAVGANANCFGVVTGTPASIGPITEGTCGMDVANYCDTTLLELSNPLTAADLAAGKTSRTRSATITITITITGCAPVPDPVADVDLVVRSVDDKGDRKQEVERGAGSTDTAAETVALRARPSTAVPSVKHIVDVIHCTSAGCCFQRLDRLLAARPAVGVSRRWDGAGCCPRQGAPGRLAPLARVADRL